MTLCRVKMCKVKMCRVKICRVKDLPTCISACLFASLMFVGLLNHFPLLTIASGTAVLREFAPKKRISVRDNVERYYRLKLRGVSAKTRVFMLPFSSSETP